MSHVHKYPRPSDEVAANAIERLDAGLRELFEERAGIREHDGQLDRPLAEAMALIDVLIQYPTALTGLTVLQVELDGSTEWVLTGDPGYALDLPRFHGHIWTLGFRTRFCRALG